MTDGRLLMGLQNATRGEFQSKMWMSKVRRQLHLSNNQMTQLLND